MEAIAACPTTVAATTTGNATALASQIASGTANQSELIGATGGLTSRYASTAAQAVHRPSGSVNLNLHHTFADSATAATLSADADYGRYRIAEVKARLADAGVPTRPPATTT